MNNTPNFAGFYRADINDAPGSIGAALSTGLVTRHFDKGYLVIHGRGKLSAAECIAQGLMDQAAADIVAQQESCAGRPPVAVDLAAVPERRAAPYEGTPVGDLVQAMQAWVTNPQAEESATALCAALVAFQQASKAVG